MLVSLKELLKIDFFFIQYIYNDKNEVAFLLIEKSLFF